MAWLLGDAQIHEPVAVGAMNHQVISNSCEHPLVRSTVDMCEGASARRAILTQENYGKSTCRMCQGSMLPCKSTRKGLALTREA